MDQRSFASGAGLIIYRISQKVKYTSQAGISYRNCDRARRYLLPSLPRTRPSVEFMAIQRTDIVTNLLCYLGGQLCAV